MYAPQGHAHVFADWLDDQLDPHGVGEFYLDPHLLDRLGVPDADERRVVEQTVVFLAERQPVIDFPAMVDLEDVLAAYDDYPQRLRELPTG